MIKRKAGSFFVDSAPVLYAVLWLSFSMISGADSARAQIQRKLADPGGPVDELFLTQNLIVSSSVTNLEAGNLNFTIMHVFGRVNRGAGELWGLDDPANIRFGLDFGISDRLSIGVGRSRFDKLFDFRFKAKALRQTKDDRIPLEVAIKGDMGINTVKNGFSFSDRLNYLGAILIARRVSDRVSLQITPMVSHFNTVFIENDGVKNIRVEENTHYAVSFGGRILITDRLSVLAEYMPVFGDRTTGTVDAFAVAIDIEVGGHVFQVFVKSSDWLTEQHVIARTTDDFLDGDIRFGFNINRMFSFH